MKYLEIILATAFFFSAAFCASGQTYLDPGPGAVPLNLPPDELRALESQLRAKQSEFRRKLATAGRVDGHSGPNDGPLSPDPTDEWRRYYREIHGKEWQPAVQPMQYGQCYYDKYGNKICQQQIQYQEVQLRGWPDPRVVHLEGGGTAAFVERQGKVCLASCAHESATSNVQPGKRVKFYCNDGSVGTAVVREVDGRSDCSILSIESHRRVGRQVRPFPIATTPLRPGEKVWVVGFPMGRYRVRTTTVEIDGDTLQLHGAGTPGESGGPIVNARGELVGVLSSDEVHPQTNRSVGRTLCAGWRPIATLLDSLMPNRSGAFIARQDQVAPPGYRMAAVTPRQASYGSPGGYGGYNGNGNGYTNGNGYPPMQPPTDHPQPPAEHKHDDILQLIEQQNQLMIQFGEAAKEGNAIVRANIEITEAAIANMQQQVAQIQQQNQELKNDIKNEINVIDERLRPIEDNPPPTAEEIVDEFDKRPIRLRLHIPGKRPTEYVELRPGKDATIEVDKVKVPKPAQ